MNNELLLSNDFQQILTLEQMTYSEKKSQEFGTSLSQLMDNAGRKLAENILKICRNNMTKNVVLLIGKGNNGGDGLVAANYLIEADITPTVILCCKTPSTELAKAAFERLYKSVNIKEYPNNFTVEDFQSLLSSPGVLVDCVFGTGFHGELPPEISSLFKHIPPNVTKIACDIPSGINGGNGLCCLDGNFFKADFTITFHKAKVGMYLSPGKYYCGKIIMEDIGIPKCVSSSVCCSAPLDYPIFRGIDNKKAKCLLPKRIPWGNKGTFGKVLCVCGSRKYMGAAKLSCTAALRSGAGLVYLFSPKNVIDNVCINLPECIFIPAKEDSDGFISCDALPEILEYSKSAKCILVGCGLGNNASSQKLTSALIEQSEIPLIIDADGINSVCPNIDVLKNKKAQVILTPHPGELARLCGVSLEEILADRVKFASELSQKYNVWVIAKGCETFAVSPDGALLIETGNTALSKGGSGDTLAGITASLIAQGSTAFEACCLSPYILGKTAEMLSKQFSQRGILPSDIANALPRFLKLLEDS